jgi:hypothetical protein
LRSRRAVKLAQRSRYVWKKKDDIYICQDKIGGYVKTSLHSNRHCRVAITKERYTQITGREYSGSRPALTAWVRPETKTDGWVIGVSILFVPELLSPYDVVYDRDTIEIESPCPGKAISVDMIFSRLPPEAIAPNPSQGVLGHTQLSTGEHFIVVGGIIPFDINEFSQRADLSISRYLQKQTERLTYPLHPYQACESPSSTAP